MITRLEFKQFWIDQGIDVSAKSIMWAVERHKGILGEPRWFVCVRPISDAIFLHETSSKEFWEWCRTNIKEPMICYSSSEKLGQEWWGFVNRDDAALFALTWG